MKNEYGGIRYYRRDGTPYEGPNALMNWAEDFEKIEYKIVKQEKLWNGFFVSTVWLGLDHSFISGPPIIFETMVFSKDTSFDDLDMDRYSTEAEALAGHQRIANKYKGVVMTFKLIGYRFLDLLRGK